MNKKLFRFDDWERITASLITKIEDKYYLFGTVINNFLQSNEIRRSFVLVTDLNFNEIKSKIYEDIPVVHPRADFYSCMISPDKTQLWLITEKILGTIPNFGLHYPTLIIYDTNLNIVSYKSFPFYIHPNLGDVTVDYRAPITAKLITDSTFIVGSANFQRFHAANEMYYMLGLSEMDTSLKIVPITYIDKKLDSITRPAYYICMDFINPNEIYFAGHKEKLIDNPSWLFIGKANRNLEVSKIIYYGGDAIYWSDEIKCLSEKVCLIGKKNDAYKHGFPIVLSISNEAFETNILGKPTIEWKNEKFLSVFPNPFDEYIEIKVDKACTISIYNTDGKIMFSEKLLTKEARIYTHTLLSRVYIYVKLLMKMAIEAQLK